MCLTPRQVSDTCNFRRCQTRRRNTVNVSDTWVGVRHVEENSSKNRGKPQSNIDHTIYITLKFTTYEFQRKGHLSYLQSRK